MLWRVPQALWLCGSVRSLILSYGDCPNIVRVSVTTLKGPIVNRGLPPWWERLEENTVSRCGVWGALCLHYAPTESSIRKGVKFKIYRCLHVPRLSFYLRFFTYSIYFVIDFAHLAITYLLVFHSISCCCT
jgi:hypothetical protein